MDGEGVKAVVKWVVGDVVGERKEMTDDEGAR